jgi:hypothetical protein
MNFKEESCQATVDHPVSEPNKGSEKQCQAHIDWFKQPPGVTNHKQLSLALSTSSITVLKTKLRSASAIY